MNFLFYFSAVLTLFLARLSLGDSYQSGECDISSAGWVDDVATLDFFVVITLEHGGSMHVVLAHVLPWFTHGEVLIITGAVSCVDVWCVGLFTIGMSHVFLLKISAIFASAWA